MKTFTNEFHPESPVFAALASLREIFRDLVAAPRAVYFVHTVKLFRVLCNQYSHCIDLSLGRRTGFAAGGSPLFKQLAVFCTPMIAGIFFAGIIMWISHRETYSPPQLC